jgi:hypothetical protein
MELAVKDKTKGRLFAGLSVVALAVVVGAPAAASWHGLVATARDVFGLHGGWEYVVPLSLDGAAFYSGVLAIRAILAGDSAFGARLLTAIYAMSAAGFNGWHARTAEGGNIQAALFFAGASLSAVVLWDVTLRALRRDQLRTAGLIEDPLPRWRLLRWLVAPIETARAWRLAVVEQITDPAEALHLARARRGKSTTRALAERVTDAPALDGPARTTTEGDADEPRTDDVDQIAIEGAGDVPGGDRCDLDRAADTHGSGSGSERRLDVADGRGGRAGDVPASGFRLTADARKKSGEINKAAALREVFDHLGRKDVPAALALLDTAGVSVDRSYAYTVAWKPALRAVTQ